MCHDVMNIQLVQHGIRILAQTCCEYDDLINLAHFFQEVVHARALDYVDIVPVILDFDRYNIISLLDRLEATVHQGLVEIKDEAFASHVLRGDWGE